MRAFLALAALLPSVAFAQPAPAPGRALGGRDISGLLQNDGTILSPNNLPPTLFNGGDVSNQLVTVPNAARSRSMTARFADDVNVLDFGPASTCNGSPTGDDTAALNAALAQAGSRAFLGYTAKGGRVRISGAARCRITANVTVPPGVTLAGDFRMRGSPTNGQTLPAWGTLGSSITLAGGASITPSNGSGIDGLLIQRDGITYAEANSAAFTGSAITVGANTADVFVTNSAIFGFATGLLSQGGSRLRVEYNYWDNLTGIDASGSGDSSRFLHNHMWPFVTYYYYANNSLPPASLARSGTGMTIHDRADGTVVDDALVLGYATGFSLQVAQGVTMRNLWCDSAPAGVCVYLGPNVVGTTIQGQSWNVGIGITINTNSIEDNTISEWQSRSDGTGFHFVSGSIKAGTLTAANATGYCGDATSANVTLDVASLRCFGGHTTQPTRADFNATTAGSAIAIRSFRSDRPANETGIGGPGMGLPTVATSDPLMLPVSGEAFALTGTTGSGNITGGYIGRRVTLFFGGATTIFSGGNVLLSGSTNFAATARSTLSLVYDGANWRETGRSQ